MTFYSLIKKVWTLLPGTIRVIVRDAVPDKLTSGLIVSLASHDDIYHSEYFEFVDREAARSAPVMAETIVDFFNPASVLDVGCGTGALLLEFKKRGIWVTGLEYSEAALRYCRERDLQVLAFDLESDPDPFPNKEFDLVISVEVAEHLPESIADRYVGLLCSHGKSIIFTAATPGQGGKDHINEQPHEYWIQKFRSHGFRFLKKDTKKWREKWEQSDISRWYSKNLMLFSKTPM